MKKLSPLLSLLCMLVIAAAAYGLGVNASAWSRQLATLWSGAPDFAQISAQAGGPLVLISTSTCPWCAQARVWLRSQGLAYRDCVVDQMPEREAVLASTGSSAVPQLISAHGRVLGYDTEAYARLVQTLDPKAVRSVSAAWACNDGAAAAPQASKAITRPTSVAPSKASVGKAVSPKPRPRDLGSLT